tara:strand:- start:282 stop:560 length:279 start_codon:yes stop_codon:yes gene_type:complete
MYKIRARLIISGIVQGVMFRYSTKKEADKLNLTGYVKNLLNDELEILVEGKDDVVKKLIYWAQSGPEFAKIDNCVINYLPYQNEFTEFLIIY